MPRPTSAYMQEAIDKGWIPIRPRPGTEPKVFIFTGPNPLRRWPSPQIAEKHLWPKLDWIVDVNFKVSTSGMNADLILPTAGYYERDSLKYTQAYLPVPGRCARRRSSRSASPSPSGRSSACWRARSRSAREQRGVSTVTDVRGRQRRPRDDLRALERRRSSFHESDPKAALDYILRSTPVDGQQGLGTSW